MFPEHVSAKVSLYEELAARYGTPLYVYDLDRVRYRYEALRTAFSSLDTRIHFAMKANYNPTLLAFLNELGASIDAVSLGDVLLAKKIGFSESDLLSTVNNITDEEMDRLVAEGVQLNIGSLSRLQKFVRRYPGEKVCLRMNPDVVAGAHAKIQTGGDLTKFGILLEDFSQALEMCAEAGVKVTGLHKHTGSGIRESEKFLTAVQNILRLVEKDLVPDLEFVDFGGGFSVPYHPDEDEIDYQSLGKLLCDEVRNASVRLGRELKLKLEPGKFLIADAGVLLTRINTKKKNRNREILGTDSGFSQLIRPIMYDAYHHILNLSSKSQEFSRYDVAGNICETGDLFATDRDLPESSEGDLLAICGAGAYCYSMGGVYNLRPMPAEVCLRDEKAVLSRRRLTEEELIDSILREVVL